MRHIPSLGDQELALLRDIAAHPETTVGEVFARYGEPNKLARSTIDTMIDRLYKKGVLIRTQDKGVYRYRSTSAPQELLSGLVHQFVERTLAGSLSPLVTYFSEQNRLSVSELQELERLVAKLQSPDKEECHEHDTADSPVE